MFTPHGVSRHQPQMGLCTRALKASRPFWRSLSTRPPARASIPSRRDPPVPEPATTSHHDLHSFLEYAHRTNLNAKSPVYVGTHYEYTVSSTLAQYGLSLRRVGGASDYGIDLLGTWKLPSTEEPLRVLVQCKAGAIGPHVIRELEGAFVGAPVGWRESGVLGVLASRRVATKGVGDALARSRWPMVFVCCSADGVVSQVRWNQRAAEEALEGVHAAVRHSGGKSGERIVLTWKGKSIAPVREGDGNDGNGPA
ncbi:hypothetical protein VUR80DRAFT_3351 [Thermomyces stellatus]